MGGIQQCARTVPVTLPRSLAGAALTLRRESSTAPRAPGPAPRGAAAPGTLRLTVRGRRVVVAIALSGALGLGAVAGSVLPHELRESELRLAGESTIVVESGDTLWSIAAMLAGDGDVRAVVHRLRVLNDLDSSVIRRGQVLRLP